QVHAVAGQQHDDAVDAIECRERPAGRELGNARAPGEIVHQGPERGANDLAREAAAVLPRRDRKLVALVEVSHVGLVCVGAWLPPHLVRTVLHDQLFTAWVLRRPTASTAKVEPRVDWSCARSSMGEAKDGTKGPKRGGRPRSKVRYGRGGVQRRCEATLMHGVYAS